MEGEKKTGNACFAARRQNLVVTFELQPWKVPNVLQPRAVALEPPITPSAPGVLFASPDFHSLIKQRMTCYATLQFREMHAAGGIRTGSSTED